MKNKISVGISSIILIFLVLCLSVFCLLSISDAKASLAFAEKHAGAVQIYYDADTAAQSFLRDYRKLCKEAGSVSERLDQLSSAIQPETILKINESGNVVYEAPTKAGQTLFLELSSDGEQIFSYYIYNSSDYIIDSRLPVFGGDD